MKRIFGITAARAFLLIAFGVVLFATLPVSAQDGAAPTAGIDSPDTSDKSLSFGHVPDLDDLTPKVRSVERRGMLPRGTPGKSSSASDWMNQSIRWMNSEDFSHAADGFHQAAAIYEQRGAYQDALVMSTYAARCETRVSLYYDRSPNTDTLRRTMTTGRRLEPVYGAYLGAFIDHEVEVNGEFQDEDASTGRPHRDVAEFDQKIGRKHAAFFTYCGYKSGMPDKWFANLKQNGAAAQWAIEPDKLEEIQDDSWLRGIARAAADSGVPVFVRFASEMNGAWTPYHEPPALYREKFQLVARIFHQIAPNAAMVWCPNEIPQTNIADYYPGDDAVDWVGVNFYSVYYNNGDASRPVGWANPADKLDYIYQHYASHHPIMICEWAATHHEKADGVDRAGFAVEKIAQLYSALPRRFPRVKAVFWLDMNAIQYANDPKTRKNDYSLLSNPSVASGYKRMVSHPYFLDHVQTDAVAETEIAALAEHTTLHGNVNLSAYVKTYDGSPTVIWSVNGRQMQNLTDPGAYDWTLNTANLPNGPARISVTVLDAKGRVAGRQTTTVLIANGSGTVVVNPHPAPAPAPPRPHPPVPPEPTPVANNATLADAIRRARVDPNVLALNCSPQNGTIFLGGRANNGLRLTAAIGANTVGGASPTVVFLLLRGSAADPIVQPLAPTGATDAALNDMAAPPGASVSAPTNPKHSFRPDIAGTYTVRAVLFPTRESARAFSIIVTTADSPLWSHVLIAVTKDRLAAGNAIYTADKRVEVVTR